MPWITINKKKQILLAIHVQPGAVKAKVAGLYGERLKVVVSAPPVDGKANKEVEKLLAKTFNISAKNISIIKGLTSRQKTATVVGISEEEIRNRIIESIQEV